MNPCPQASARLGAARHAGIVFWKEPPWRFRDFTRRLRCLMSLAFLILLPLLSQAQTNDAVSREVSLFNFGPATAAGIEAISREVSLFNLGPPTVAGIEAISREVSIFDRGFNTFDAVSREVSVFDYDFNHLNLAVGSTVVLAGTSGGVAVALWTAVPVTNVQVAVDFPQNLLTNWSVQPQSPLTGTAFVSNSSRLYLTFSPASGQSITSTQQLGQITFATASNQPSAFLPLPVASVTAPLLQDGTTYTPYKTAQEGEVVVLNKRSLLRRVWVTNGLESLTLYGLSGTNYTIESTTNLKPPAVWQPLFTLTPSNFNAATPGLGTTNPAMFFRARQ
jgi:hypothetical protein